MNRDLHETMVNLLAKGKRLSARGLDEYRDISVEYGVTRNAEGSARIKIGDTEVIAGVKMEVGTPYPDTPDQGGMMFNVELLPMSNPDFETGPPSIVAIELSRVTDRGIRESHALDVKKLCITPAEKAWTIIVDIVSINADGNLYDAIPLAALAAIKDAKFPKYEDGKLDYKTRTDESIPMSALPVTITIFKYGDALLVDPDSEEEKVYDARLTITILENGEVCSMQKGGEGTLTLDDVSKMVDIAVKKTAQLRKKL